VWPYQIDYRMEPDAYGVTEGTETDSLVRHPTVLLWGVSEQGARVVTRVYGFMPYMYLQAPDVWRTREPTEGELAGLRFALEDVIAAKCARDPMYRDISGQNMVHAVSFERKYKVQGYDAETQPLVKVTLTSPRLVPKLRACLWDKYEPEALPTDAVWFELDDYVEVVTPDMDPAEEQELLANLRSDAEEAMDYQDSDGDHSLSRKRVAYSPPPPALPKRRLVRKRALLPLNKLYECAVGFTERFLVDRKIELCDWFEVPAGAYTVMDNVKMGNEHVQFVGVLYDQLHTLSEEASLKMPAPQFYEVGYDIEARNTIVQTPKARKKTRAEFCVAARPDNPVLCICLAVHRNGEADELAKREYAACLAEGLRIEVKKEKDVIMKRMKDASLRGGWYEVFYSGTCDEEAVRRARHDKPVYFFRAENERQMLEQWMQRLLVFGPEVLQGWNSNSFDLPYINDRISLHYADDADMLRNVSPNVGVLWRGGQYEKWRCTEARFESKQSGKRGGYDVKWPGCVHVDCIARVKKDYKFRSYKLDTIAKMWLGEQKEDLPAEQITPTWDSGPLGVAQVIQYCCWDAELPWRISVVKQLTTGLIQTARVTHIQIESLITRGESVKVYTLLVEEAGKNNFAVDHHTPPPTDPNDKSRKAKYKVRSALV
jgi:DNA polymerase elongation subunit (family B)